MTLRFLVGSRNFMRFFWGSWEFCTGKIVTTDLKNLVPQQRIHDDYVIHFLHWELCDLKLSSHQNFPLQVRLHRCVICKKPSLPSSSNRYRNLGHWECVSALCSPEPGSATARDPLKVHDVTWKRVDIQAKGFSVALQEHFHRPHFHWIPVATQATHAINPSAVPHPWFPFFGFCAFMQRVFPKLHSHLRFFRVLDFCFCHHRIRNPMMKMKGEICEGVIEEELADEPRTTHGT